MKQIIFFKKTWILFLFVFICNSYLRAQTAHGCAGIVNEGYNSCSKGFIGTFCTGYFSFPIPTGLTLSQLNYLGSDFYDEGHNVLLFFVTIQCSNETSSFYVGFDGTFANWVNSGNLATEENFAQWKASNGACLVSSIVLTSCCGFDNTFFDNTVINNVTYNYDDCDQDGLLDIYDCDPAHGNNNKVLVCHDGQTICVAMPALEAHLNHGDYMGSCTEARVTNISTGKAPAKTPAKEVVIDELKLYPNPAHHQIHIRNNHNKQLGTVSIYDISGKVIYKNFIRSSRAIIDVKNFSSGVYYLRSDQYAKAIKFVKQ